MTECRVGRKRIGVALIVSLAFAIGSSRASDDSGEGAPAERLLESFVEDFRNDPFASEPVTFGVRVRGEGGGDWHIVVAGRTEGDKQAKVTLHKGFPEGGVGYFNMELATLQRVERGELAIMTAMGKARASELAPVEFDLTEGYDPGDPFWQRLSPLIFHFWTRGTPEVVPFDKERSRFIHGANIVPLYYERGLRTAWCQVEKGQHVNKDPKDQVNPFPSMFIITRGQAQARLGGTVRTIRAGEMIFVPKGMAHEVWNNDPEPCEVVLIMFGFDA